MSCRRARLWGMIGYVAAQPTTLTRRRTAAWQAPGAQGCQNRSTSAGWGRRRYGLAESTTMVGSCQEPGAQHRPPSGVAAGSQQEAELGKPILFLVNDQGRVLDALAHDLARRFGADYEIVTEGSPAAALATLAELATGSEEVALLIGAQQMQEMPGVDLLVRGHELHPTAKRVLLVGRRKWAAANPAVRAMTLGQIDTYLFEPWLPVERWLYLPVSQVLADWVPARGPAFEGIRIVGPRL